MLDSIVFEGRTGDDLHSCQHRLGPESHHSFGGLRSHPYQANNGKRELKDHLSAVFRTVDGPNLVRSSYLHRGEARLCIITSGSELISALHSKRASVTSLKTFVDKNSKRRRSWLPDTV